MKTVSSRVFRPTLAVAVTAAALVLAGCGGSGTNQPTDTGTAAAGGSLSVLIGSSGQAETDAVNAAVDAWSADAGTEAEVRVASDLSQQLSQGFAAGNPPDVFYVSTDNLGGYVANGSLEPYGDDLANKDDFFPSLVEAFTVEDQLYCAPKDFSTLALIINTDLWTAAGLTDADIPTDWASLETVARKLTSGSVVGLGYGPEIQRLGVFLAQAGGGLLTNGEATVNSEENVEALTFVQKMMNDGVAKYSSELGAGWGGEAFGKGLAAMVIEGNWITGAMSSDFPAVNYTVAELPAGPGGKGTLQYTNCWGIAADSQNKESAKALVEHLTSTEQQLAFAKAFGVMPSIESAAEEWKSEYPDLVAFINGADYAQNLPAMPGATDVIKEMNAQLESIKTADLKAMLDSVQSDLEAVVKDAQ